MTAGTSIRISELRRESRAKRRMELRRAMAAGVLLAAGLPLAAENLVVLLLGPPGSGKTTQAKQLSRRYRIPAISAAEILKKSHGKRTSLTRTVDIPTASGELVTDQTLNQLLQYRVEKKDALRGFILDGYPTSTAQAEFLKGLLKERGLPDPIVIHLDTPDRVAIERMRGRRRVDDRPAIIERRLADYRREEQFILDYYGKGRVVRVNGARTEKEVLADILAQLPPQ